MYVIIILDNNKITNEGILHIKNNQWNLLKKINLSNLLSHPDKNLISDIGCKYLT